MAQNDCYNRLLQATGLNGSSTGGEGFKESAAFCILTALSSADSRSDTYTNAVREILEVRLAGVKDTPYVREFLKPFLHQFADRFGAY
jgi:hypothetical protein